MVKIEIFRSPNKGRFIEGVFHEFKGDWFFRVKAGNGKIVAQSEGYKKIQGALKGIKSLRLGIDDAEVVVLKT